MWYLSHVTHIFKNDYRVFDLNSDVKLQDKYTT